MYLSYTHDYTNYLYVIIRTWITVTTEFIQCVCDSHRSSMLLNIFSSLYIVVYKPSSFLHQSSIIMEWLLSFWLKKKYRETFFAAEECFEKLFSKTKNFVSGSNRANAKVVYKIFCYFLQCGEIDSIEFNTHTHILLKSVELQLTVWCVLFFFFFF